MSSNGSASAHRTEQTAPVDATIASLIDEARGRDRGFAMGVERRLDEEGRREIVYRVEQSLPPADTWEPPAPYRSHRLDDIGSCVRFARRYGSQDRTLVMYDDAGVVVVLDELVEVGRREKAVMPWRYSQELRDWQGILGGRPVEHRPLMDFLLLRQANLDEPTILDRMRTVRAAMRVKVDSDLRLDQETAGVVFESQAGPEIVAFPRRFTIAVPVLEDELIQEDAWVRTDVCVEVVLPRKADDTIRFILIAPKLRAQIRAHLGFRIGALEGALEGWCVLAGTHMETEREIGRERDRE